MNTNSPQFLFIGRKSQVLDSYRRNLTEFSVQVAPFGGEISSFESISALFIDVEHLSELKNWSELSKISSVLPVEVPIIVISAVDEAELRSLNPRFRVLKKPLQPGELLHEAKSVIAQRNYVIQTIQAERLAAIRLVLRGVSHELGNIVLRIAAKADLAMLGDAVEVTHRHVGGIIEAAQKASMLVRNLQSFAKGQPHYTSGKLSMVIEDVLRRMNPAAQKIIIQKKWDFPAGEPDMSFDIQAMAQVFFNIFENAVIAMPEGGTLSIEMKPGRSVTTAVGTTHAVEIRVRDTGTGMTPDILKRAFDFAYSTRKHEASGLGLPIARELVLSHGGEFELKSEPQHGIEISIWLPARPC